MLLFCSNRWVIWWDMCRLTWKDQCLQPCTLSSELYQILLGLSYGTICEVGPTKDIDINIFYFYRSVGDPQQEFWWGSFEYERNTLIEVLLCIEIWTQLEYFKCIRKLWYMKKTKDLELLFNCKSLFPSYQT